MQVHSAIHELHVRAQHTFLVRNRTQRENDNRLSLSAARELELRDLGHPDLQRGAAAAGYGLGVAELAERLVQLQERRITQSLPALATRIQQRERELRAEIERIGTVPDSLQVRWPTDGL